jgi:hypothetical protein
MQKKTPHARTARTIVRTATPHRPLNARAYESIQQIFCRLGLRSCGRLGLLTVGRWYVEPVPAVPPVDVGSGPSDHSSPPTPKSDPSPTNICELRREFPGHKGHGNLATACRGSMAGVLCPHMLGSPPAPLSRAPGWGRPPEYKRTSERPYPHLAFTLFSSTFSSP